MWTITANVTNVRIFSLPGEPNYTQLAAEPLAPIQNR
jgi:hypothetical protein